MKTVISIPDDVFKKAEKLARRKKKSRSELYTDAVRDYIHRHADDEDTTDAMNRVVKKLGGSTKDPFITAAARRVIERVEWK